MKQDTYYLFLHFSSQQKTVIISFLKEEVELVMQTTAYEKGSQYGQEGHRKQFETLTPMSWLLNLYNL